MAELHRHHERTRSERAIGRILGKKFAAFGQRKKRKVVRDLHMKMDFMPGGSLCVSDRKGTNQSTETSMLYNQFVASNALFFF